MVVKVLDFEIFEARFPNCQARALTCATVSQTRKRCACACTRFRGWCCFEWAILSFRTEHARACFWSLCIDGRSCTFLCTELASDLVSSTRVSQAVMLLVQGQDELLFAVRKSVSPDIFSGVFCAFSRHGWFTTVTFTSRAPGT